MSRDKPQDPEEMADSQARHVRFAGNLRIAKRESPQQNRPMI